MTREKQNVEDQHRINEARNAELRQQMEGGKRNLKESNEIFVRKLLHMVDLAVDQVRYDDTKNMDSFKEVSSSTMDQLMAFATKITEMRLKGMVNEEELMKKHERDELEEEKVSEKELEKVLEKLLQELEKKRVQMMRGLDELEEEFTEIIQVKKQERMQMARNSHARELQELQNKHREERAKLFDDNWEKLMRGLEKERKERMRMLEEQLEKERERMQMIRDDHAQELQKLQNHHEERAELCNDSWEKLMRDLGLREAEELSTNDQNVEASNFGGILAPSDQSQSLGNPEVGESARDAPKPEGRWFDGGLGPRPTMPSGRRHMLNMVDAASRSLVDVDSATVSKLTES
ncbi:hypothetical protein BDQ17DRAFT_309762 [Cyathus striatus]|nr:hypothetical protein BDQ17DRAFT_309762 [Cyathus striatus]